METPRSCDAAAPDAAAAASPVRNAAQTRVMATSRGRAALDAVAYFLSSVSVSSLCFVCLCVLLRLSRRGSFFLLLRSVLAVAACCAVRVCFSERGQMSDSGWRVSFACYADAVSHAARPP